MPESPSRPGPRTLAVRQRPRPRPPVRSRADLRVLVLRVLVSAAVAALGSLLWAPPASAHDELLDLQPGNKVVVSTPPTRIELVFGAAPLSIGTQIRVTDPKGTVVSTGPVVIDGGTVVERLTGRLIDGVYRVDWRVTASDGHPVSGTYTFTLKATGSAPTPGPAGPSSSASAGARASAPAPPSSEAPPESGTTSGSGSSDSGSSRSGSSRSGSSGSGSSGSGPSTGLAIALAAGVVVAVGTAIALLLLRRRNDAPATPEGNPDT